VSALSLDLNQSYVVTTAERLKCEPRALAETSHGEVGRTLAAADIEFDIVGMPDGRYTEYVSDWFGKLHAAGAFLRVDRPAAYDCSRGRVLFESYASGRCPWCLANTRGNICECCGRPNDPLDLLDLHPTGGAVGAPLERLVQPAWMLDLEAYRTRISTVLDRLLVAPRPTLRRLIDDILGARLPLFPITFASSWGIPSPFDGAQGEVLNVWAEMVPGHYWWLRQAAAMRDCGDPFNAGDVEYFQYLGFDNSFFYVFAHLALALAAEDAGLDALLPSAFVTNEFLLLEDYKFSTSQGHLIWGKDLLAASGADEVRFFLAWTNPELQQSNFSHASFESVVDKELRKPLASLFECNFEGAGDTERARQLGRYNARLAAQFHSAYEAHSLRSIARVISNAIVIAAEQASAGASCAALAPFLTTLALGAAPLVPGIAERIWNLAGESGPMEWRESANCVP